MRGRTAMATAWLVVMLCSSCLRVGAPEEFSCEKDSDCRQDEQCYFSRVPLGRFGKCRSAAYCELPEDCGSPLRQCRLAQCVDVECTTRHTNACGNYACDTHNTCRKSCVTDIDCSGDAICDDAACVDPFCDASTSAQSCGPDYRCSEGRCTESCVGDVDCAAGRVCRDGSCRLPPRADGAGCAQDADCASGLCCPSAAPDRYTCAEACVLSPLEAECGWDEGCESGRCVDGRCAECRGQECVERFCGERECGVFAGTDCGRCGESEVCNADGRCIDPCADFECGLWLGKDCGTCEGQHYCNVGHCLPACVDRVCGTDHGVDCGDCAATHYCDTVEGACVLGCVDMECGTDHGVDCGTCEDGMACDAGACVQTICPVDQSYYCKDEDVWWCNAGLSEMLSDNCGTDEYCVENEQSCRRYLCEADEDFCDGDVFGTCSSDRRSMLPGSVDCAAAGLDCTHLGCGTAVTDAVGSCVEDAHTTSAAFGNIYRVDVDTTLLWFGQCFDLDSAATTRWFVAEADARSGPYTTVHSVTLHSDHRVGVRYSPNLDLPLTAGKYYILGVEPVDGSVRYNRKPYNAAAEPTAFGEKVGGALREEGLVDGWSGVTSDGNYLQYVRTVTFPE